MNRTVSVPYTKLTSTLSATSVRAAGSSKIVRTPTVICLSAPAVPASVTSTGRLRVRIRATRSADRAKLPASMANTVEGGPSRRRPAPIAGPATTTRL